MDWVEAQLASYSKVRTKKDLKDAIRRINAGEQDVDVDIYAYFGVGPGQQGIMGVRDLLTYPELRNVGLVIRDSKGNAMASVWNEGGKLKVAGKTASDETGDMTVCPYCGSDDLSQGSNYTICLACGLTWGHISNPDILGVIDNVWLERNGLKTSWTGGVMVHAADKGLMYPSEDNAFVDVISYVCEKCGYTWHTYNAGP